MFDLFKKKNEGVQLILKVNGMHCSSCAMNIDGDLEDLEGIFSSTTNYAKGVAVVYYDPKKISLKKISQTIIHLGYSVVES